MSEETIVAVYDAAAHADAAVRDLEAANVPSSAITRHAKNHGASSVTQSESRAPAQERGFWGKMFGGEPDDRDTSVYDRSLESGSTVVTVKAPEQQISRISDILEKHNPIDVDERAASYGTSGTTTTRTDTARTGTVGTDTARATGTATGGGMQLAEETLSVGKRAINRGTTRVRRYTVETPVQEQVTLHSEKVSVDRHAVTDGRPVGTVDFTDKVVEMTETSEEAVVSKTARVREEVNIHKQADDRVETVKDTVRRQEVEIEQVPGTETRTSRTTGETPVTTGPTGTTRREEVTREMPSRDAMTGKTTSTDATKPVVPPAQRPTKI